MTAPRIITEQIDFGGWSLWRAHDDRMGADTSPYGTGATEAEAVDDLKRQLEDLQ